MSLLFFIYWKRRQSSLPHLDKHHKESGENSYSSSKNSRDSSPKGAVDSFNPVYDEIKLKGSQVCQNDLIKMVNTNTPHKKCCNNEKHDDPHYSTVFDQSNKGIIYCGSNSNCNQKALSCEEKSQLNNACTNGEPDKVNSREYETHTYALVDMKKKSEEQKVHECNLPQEVHVHAMEHSDSDGGTPPPVPPHTPEMFQNDGGRHDERCTQTKD